MKNKEKTKIKTNKRPNIMPYLKKYRFWVFLYILLSVIGEVGGFFNVILFARGIEYITIKNFLAALYVILIAIGINIAQRVFNFLHYCIYNKFTNKFMSELNCDLAKQAFKLNSKTYNDHDTGTFVLRIVEDPSRIVDALAQIVEMITQIFTSLGMMIYITTLNHWCSLAMVAIIVVGFAIEFKRVRVSRKNRAIVKRKYDQINSLTTEIVRSEKDIKSLGLEEKLSEVSKKNYEDYRKLRYNMDKIDSYFWTSRNFVVGVGSMLVLLLGVYLMDIGLMTMATFMIIYSNNHALWTFVFGIGQIANRVVDIKVSHSRMFSLFDENEFVSEKFGTESLEKVVGKIEFKNVSYSFKEWKYPDHTKKSTGGGEKGKTKEKELLSENKIFDNLSFKIQPNATVAFVGKSGSGKSTILNLMSKMYESDDGEVLIDGVDIKTLNKETIRKTISLVNQFPYIFDMTIKDNLLLARSSATDEEIWEAIKKASLDEFVGSLPNGIETKVGESGIKLSGGQKQRLAIARAFLRESNIIIFDESTSSLDNFAQEDVKKSIDALKGRSTIVIVAHRLSTVKNVDKIFFLDGGKIVDEGTFEQLFDRNEKFKAMFLAENV